MYEKVGHGDMLDDSWADIARQIPWVPGAMPDRVEFAKWNVKGMNGERDIRAAYRDELADDICNFFSDVMPKDRFIAPYPD